ncbi:quercetin dioxygenase-like cupin family protein [Breznakibacter xylanolyticus]|uniref:Quercetin dioxygenase-like cupin family protein n=1 Tax=Breznakibacter xylanolyticus TaxID=990 RepID=A0A2W7MSW2_9BACT|nr:cupin domain-containing protein [Breznakibacter xylanolyticus]PZX10633.1 quercetin dioxygenase-like cupin family protein [Breznakibacter xylanolyticus]
MNNLKIVFTIGIVSLSTLFVACNSMKVGMDNQRGNEPAFPKGNKITNNNFVGTAWITMMVTDSVYNTSIGTVTFEPGARTNWHKHPGGQILLITDGQGYYQEKGKPAQLLKKGDVVEIRPMIEHWHGATPQKTLIHIAVGTNTVKGSVVWLQQVSNDEYLRATMTTPKNPTTNN